MNIADDLRDQYDWIKSKPARQQQSGHLRSIVRLIERTSAAEEKNRNLREQVTDLIRVNARLKTALEQMSAASQESEGQ